MKRFLIDLNRFLTKRKYKYFVSVYMPANFIT